MTSRSKRAFRPLFASALVSIQLVSQSALAADKWFLLARHGECFPIRSLERKFPDIGSVAEPESFIHFVRAKGLTVSSKAVAARAGSAVEVLVPDKGLALVFVTAELCSKVEAR
jgi:hypothetical protein